MHVSFSFFVIQSDGNLKKAIAGFIILQHLIMVSQKGASKQP